MSTGSSRPVARLLLGDEPSVSTLFSLAGFALGMVAPLGLLAVEVSGVALHVSAQQLLAVVMAVATGAAVANAYCGGGLLAGVGVVLLVPVRVAVATVALDEVGVHLGLAPGVDASQLVAVALVGGVAAHAAGAMAASGGSRLG